MKLLCFLFLFASIPAFSQAELIGTITRHCDAMHRFRNFNGNILVAQKGKVIFQKSYGYANLKTHKPLTINSVFNICSITKEFTATAVMLCTKDGLLSLDDTLRKFYPELPYNGVTIRHMLQHTSGIPSTEVLFKEWTSERPMQMADLIPLLTNKKPSLLNMPGAEFRYSNIPYILLALIIEKVTGKPYALFLREKIFNPLTMAATSVGRSGNNAANTNDYLYDYVSDSANNKTYFTPDGREDWRKGALISGLYGNGNIFSTTADLLKWQLALNRHHLLSREVYEAMITETVPAGTAGIQHYGYGFSVNYSATDTMIFHNGGTLGYSTSLRYIKNKDIVIISLANTNRANDPADGITALIRGEKLLPPAALKEKKVARQQLQKFVGTYEAGGRQFNIELINDTLFRKTTGGAPLRLIPSSTSRLFYADESDRELIFDEVAKNIIFLLKADGLTVPIRKVK